MDDAFPLKQYAIVAAAPGFSVVEGWLNDDDGSVDLSYTPVVAWLVDAEKTDRYDQFVSWAVPVTPQLTPRDYGIRCPDGATIFPETEWCAPGDELCVKRVFAERLARPSPK